MTSKCSQAKFEIPTYYSFGAAGSHITDAELGLEGYVMFRKDRMGRRGGGVLLYIKESIPAYEVQLQEEADCKEALWCNLVTGHTRRPYGAT